MRKAGLILALFLATISYASAYSSPGRPAGFVNDFASVLSGEEKTALEAKLKNFSASSSNEIAVAIVNSLGGDTIENFAVKLFEDWKIGKEKKDNGVLILAAMQDKQVRIEVGYGLEGALTDARSSSIIRNDIVPNFKGGNYYGGLDKAAGDIIAVTKGEYAGENSTGSSADGYDSFSGSWFAAILIGIFMIRGAFAALKKKVPWWVGGAWGSVVGLAVSAAAGFALIYILIYAILGLVVNLFLIFLPISTIAGRRIGGRGPWDGRGSGFGGFGGGSSGGGGASGRW